MKKFISVCLAVCLLAAYAAVGCAVPGPEMKITEENVLAVMDVYDPDDAFILREASAKNEPFTQWWEKNETFLERIDVSVHESTHVFCTRKPGGLERKHEYYLGGGKGQAVKLTDFFCTSEMADSVPKENRTFRYDTYVAPEKKDTIGSDVEGVYGLMDEFTAYCRSLCVMVALYDYLVDQDASADEWLQWYGSCESYRLSFAEFRYYILFYMTYAKEHHPDVYEAVLNNGNFVSAYRSVERTYKEAVDRYDELLRELCSRLEEQGESVRMKDGFLFIGSNGRGSFVEDYNKLIAACQSLQEAADALHSVDVEVVEYEEFGSDGFSFTALIAALRARWEAAKVWVKQAFERARDWLEQAKEKITRLFSSSGSAEATAPVRRPPCIR